MAELATALSSWTNFYVIVGSSAGALVGLQFVVMALISNRQVGVNEGTLNAFGTPTVVHLAVALVVSAMMCAPWPSSAPLTIALGAGGLAGLGYCVIVVLRARRQSVYQPVMDDWIWHTVFPCMSYASLASITLLGDHPRRAAFIAAAGVLSLLLIGIHNAWDTVAHVVIMNAADAAKKTD